MDTNHLINLVRGHCEIYDAKHPKHRNKNHIASLWKNIAEEMKTNEEEVRKRWANLCSNFMREKRKLNTFLEGGSQPQITWPHFHTLKFIDNSMEYREKCAGDHPEDETMESKKLYSEDSFAESLTSVYRRASKEIIDGMYIKHLEMISSKREDEFNDPDFMFLRSLLPMMKQLRTADNLSFKAEVIQFLKNKLSA